MAVTNRALVVLVVALAAALLGGCSDDKSASGSAATGGQGALEGTITVSAAASLTGAFTQITDEVMADNPDLDIELNLDSSSTLVTQILDGAPADVFASAAEPDMTTLDDARLIDGEPEVFARNRLVIVTPPGNPDGISGLDDLADVEVVSLCGEDVPCGRYAAQVLGDAGVAIPEDRVTRGQNASATLTAVTDGDAGAAIVYSSDAVGAGDRVDAVEIPDELNVIAVYPIGVITDSDDAEAARAFVDFVLGAEGQRVLEEFGFLPAS